MVHATLRDDEQMLTVSRVLVVHLVYNKTIVSIRKHNAIAMSLFA